MPENKCCGNCKYAIPGFDLFYCQAGHNHKPEDYMKKADETCYYWSERTEEVDTFKKNFYSIKVES